MTKVMKEHKEGNVNKVVKDLFIFLTLLVKFNSRIHD